MARACYTWITSGLSIAAAMLASSPSLGQDVAAAARATCKVEGPADVAIDPERVAYLDDRASAALFDTLDYQRAIQAYIWAVPMVNSIAFSRALAASGLRDDAPGILMIDHPKAASQALLTANLDIIYAFTVADLSKLGPIVVDIPAGVLGGVVDYKMRGLEDFGAGPLRNGGRIIVAPANADLAETGGLRVIRSATDKVYLFGRGMAFDRKQAKASIALLSRLQVGALRDGLATNPLPVILQGDRPFDGGWPKDIRYFDYLRAALAEMPRAEPEEKLMIGMLGGLGLLPGEAPASARTACILGEAAKTGAAMVANLAYRARAPRAFWPDRHWERAVLATTPNGITPGKVEIDERAAGWYLIFLNQTYLYSTGPVPGQGSFYLNAYADGTGGFLDGDRNYVLHFPSPPPVGDFWSVTLYDAITRAQSRTTQLSPVFSSKGKLAANPDGSIDLYIGRTSPGAGRNWIATEAGRPFFVMFRAFGPLAPMLDRSWRMEDLKHLPD